MRMKKNDEDSTLSHTKWNCSYHIVFDQNIEGKQFTEN